MHFYVTLTSECNLQCKYCYGEAYNDFDSEFNNLSVDYSLPPYINYEISELKKFCERDPNNVVLIFYGGEPLLCIDKIEQIMDSIKAKAFMLQTNGILLNKLKKDYVKRLHTILVSIDGNEKLTDFYRGEGTYQKVVENVKALNENGFEGELIARMTVMEQTDIFTQVCWLLFNEDFPFPAVHWQLDAMFWEDLPNRQFVQWIENKYNPQIVKLVKLWVRYLRMHQKVLKIHPFIGITQSLLLNESSLLRCGAGYRMYAIQTDGNITPCPVMTGMKDFYMGNIKTSRPHDLTAVFVSEPCLSCDLYNICGGRCLYANATKRWGSDGYRFVCKTIKNLIDALKAVLPEIQHLIATGRLCIEDFNYTRYNSCEIIP